MDSLFDEQQPPQRLRTVLARVFPQVVFQRKSSKYTSHFTVRFSIGAALALASGTEEVALSAQLEGSFVLQYAPHHNSSKSPVTQPHWTVQMVETRHWLQASSSDAEDDDTDTEATTASKALLLSTS